MDNDGFGGGLLGTLFLGAMFFLTDRAATKRTEKAMRDQLTDLVKDAEIDYLRRELNKAKGITEV